MLPRRFAVTDAQAAEGEPCMAPIAGEGVDIRSGQLAI